MISAIKIRNYKAFEDAQIDIKPINIFLGANSVGKTSILQLFLLLKQTASFSLINNNSPLKMYGAFANMGSVENLFHNQDTKTPIEIGVRFKDNEIKRYCANLLDEFLLSLRSIVLFVPIKGLLDYRSIDFNRLKERSGFVTFVKDVFSILGKNAIEKYRTSIGFAISRNSNIAIPDIDKADENIFIYVYDLLTFLNSNISNNSTFEINYRFILLRKKLCIDRVSVAINEKELLTISREENSSITSDIAKLTDNDKSCIYKHFLPNKSIFECVMSHTGDKEGATSTTMSNTMLSIVEFIIKALRDEFAINKINHVGPLRSSPKRYYLLDNDRYTQSLDTLDGEALIEILKDKPKIAEKVNMWLNGFGFNIDVKQDEDVIHHLMVEQDNLKLDIMDVGFGISQILPIILQCNLAVRESITLIEQPEIHLHPKMQASFSDLLKDVVNSTGKDRAFIIETHSEYLLRRLRRRIAEKEDVDNNDVAIYMFKGKNKEKNYATIERLDISDTGAFEWPEDFYGKELLDDTLIFLKKQKQ